MITNGTARQENYYRVNFGNYGEVFAYGVTALDAIGQARLDFQDDMDEPLGNATARPAVYKEWNYGTERYTNGGDFIRH